MITKYNHLLIILLAFWIFFLNGQVVSASESLDEQAVYEEVIQELQVDDLQAHWSDLIDQYQGFMPDLKHKSFIELLKDEEGISIASISKGVIHYLLYELRLNGQLIGSLIVLTIFSSILQTILVAFEKSAINKIANFVIWLVLLFIILQSFYVVLQYARDSIQLMSSFIVALFPLLLGIIASLGQLAQVAFFHPIVILFIHFSSLLLAHFVFPLLYLAALLTIVSHMNERFKVIQLAQLLRSISLSSLSVFLAVFLTILSIQGAASAVQDGVALKTTKFISSNFIPVIGSAVTDAADTILSASLLLKNTIGMIGLFIVVLYALFPAIKIAILAFIYKLVAALLEPIAPKAIAMSLQSISQYMLYILACLLGMTFTFFLSIVIIVAASNIPLLLR